MGERPASHRHPRFGGWSRQDPLLPSVGVTSLTSTNVRLPSVRLSRPASALLRAVGALLALAAVWYWWRVWSTAAPGFPTVDIGHYLDATRRWLETGTPYLAHEVAADFEYSPLTYLHPPIALLLFAPFLILPVQLFWILPIALLVAFVAWCRPAAWAWPLIGAALLWHQTAVALVAGNSDLWVAAFIAAGLWLGWPFALVIIKPSLGFFALLGVRSRSWWIAVAMLGGLSLLFGRLWLDWLQVVTHAPGGLLYSLVSLPLMLLPIVAWLARDPRSPNAPGSPATAPPAGPPRS